MADFESSLKRAWKEMALGSPCSVVKCKHWHSGLERKWCRGHAALLEMVDKIHLPNCLCRRPGGGAGCHIERRRLRAAVGVEE